MQPIRSLAFVALAACLPVVGACSSGQSSSGGIVATAISSALDNVQANLRDHNITVSQHDSMLPRAEITPQGDFIVGGKTVSITPAQRAELLVYRKQMIAIASEGIAIGKQGAALGMHAAGTALAAAFSGKSDKEIQQKVEAQTSGIRQAAARICDRLPAMLTEQQKLAAVLPAFKPYATMTQDDISDCREDALKDNDSDD